MSKIAKRSVEMSQGGGVFWPQGVDRPPHATYSDEDRYRAARAWLVLGSLRKAGEETGISYRTLSDWSRSSWWKPLVDFVLEHEEHIIRANFRKTQDLAMTELHDRIKNGDAVHDKKTGKIIRVPIKGKDLATIAAISYDKLRLSEGRPGKIEDKTTDEKLSAMLKQFKDIASENRLKDVVSEQGNRNED